MNSQYFSLIRIYIKIKNQTIVVVHAIYIYIYIYVHKLFSCSIPSVVCNSGIAMKEKKNNGVQRFRSYNILTMFHNTSFLVK